jgi:hypothetical protein
MVHLKLCKTSHQIFSVYVGFPEAHNLCSLAETEFPDVTPFGSGTLLLRVKGDLLERSVETVCGYRRSSIRSASQKTGFQLNPQLSQVAQVSTTFPVIKGKRMCVWIVIWSRELFVRLRMIESKVGLDGGPAGWAGGGLCIESFASCFEFGEQSLRIVNSRVLHVPDILSHHRFSAKCVKL